MKRVSAPERTRERLRALIEGQLGTAPDRSNLVLLAAQLILEEALEGEVRDEIGRDRYERADGQPSGYRNGYRTGRMKTAEGMVEYAAPQVRETAEPFVSRIRQNLAGRTGALEDLAVELYARGLSTRDIEDAFTDEAGRRLLSRAAVSEITERLWAEYEAFTTRDLGEHRVVYLFVDGIAERLRAGQPREAVLAAWGIGEDGRLGHRRGRAQGAPAPDGRVKGGHRDRAGLLPGHARAWARRSAARRLGWCAGDHPGP
jgi:putative transposase